MSESPQISASLLRLKLLDALRGGDTLKIDLIVNELNSSKANIHNQELIQLKETILHYAVQVASLSTIQFLVQNASKYGLDINSQDPEGNTPLHLAAMASRQDVVKYLLSLPDINDTIVNLNRNQPVEVAKDLNLAQLMQFERAKFVEKSASDLRTYFSKRDFDNLERLLVSNPRASELLDINGADPETGNTVLHEFIKKDDLQMCDWILKHGGDPFKRDKRGRLPIDLVNSKDDALRKLLKAASKDQTIMDPVAATNAAVKTGSAPVYKGYLRKWTNFASGYKLRYFVLDEYGILSYYANQDDTSNACRGSLNLGYATLHLDSSEKMKFEIYGKNGLRWHLKANHPIETNRWVWTLQNAITIAKDNLKRRQGVKRAPTTSSTSTSASSGAGAGAGAGAGVAGNAIGSNSPEEYSYDDSESIEKKRHRLRIPGRRKHKRNASQASNASTGEQNLSRASTVKSNLSHSEAQQITGLAPLTNLSDSKATREQTPDINHSAHDTDNENFDYDADELEGDDYDSDTEASIDFDQLNDEIATIKRSLQIELASLLELFERVMTSETFEPHTKQAEVCIVGKNTIKAVHELVGKYNLIVDSRDGKLKKDLDRQHEVNKLWEKSIRQLENEVKAREDKLAVFQGQRKQLRKYLSGGSAIVKSSGTISPAPGARSSAGVAPIAKGEVLEESPVDEDQLQQVDHKLDEVVHHQGEQQIPQNVIGELLGEDSDDEFFDADEFEEEEEEAEEAEEVEEGKEIGDYNDDAGAGNLEPQHSRASINQDLPVPEENTTQDNVEQKHQAVAPVQESRSHLETENGQGGVTRDQKDFALVGAAGVAGAAAVGASHNDVSVSPRNETLQEEKVTQEHVPQESLVQAPPAYTSSNEPHQPINEKQQEAQTLPSDDGLNPVQKSINHQLHQEGSFLGYENPPRTKLSMDEDNRPKVGLWGILKSMIGKDMTRMTLPVSFNEPTSLLQRLTEDIEYNDLLNIAAGYDDSTLRLIYVATFAATEYSSTIDRIAKPFNPLLGETYEYARPDQNYRLFVEQVSHHPPISACHALSPKWDYYGENAVDSKFSGRSFDFKHLGKMFCAIRPDNGVKDKNGKVVAEELYSWKKVNTAVVGIMIGNPTVDNYGKMIVTNHTTGDTITVDMKQRGWRASSAYQLSGQALDRNGVPQWAMGGHWNSKIFAKKITKEQQDGGSSVQRKMSIIEDPDKGSAKSTDPFSGAKFLVWQVAPRPKVPFNLTAFAVTLNGLDDNLKKWIAPTDTRLRPDQRDMEEGNYDRAADEKHRVEVKQRQARKRREEKGETYTPNWFTKKKHPVTGDMFWDYNGKYWPERKNHNLANAGDIF